jgi:hypothetical protein
VWTAFAGTQQERVKRLPGFFGILANAATCEIE